MDKKLTLSLDAAVIESAKAYAKSQGTSLSRMIENYLASIIPKSPVPMDEIEISPMVAKLVGVVELPENGNLEDDYSNYLNEKYQ